MKVSGMALVAAFAALGACGGEKPASDAMPAGGTAAAVAAMPATGKTIEIKMIGDEKGYRFEPANFTVSVGDAVKFTTISGHPHNIAFTSVPAAARAQLQANLPEAMGDLMGKMLAGPSDSYTISFAGLVPGKYEYNCTPHLVNNMTGVITVQ